MSEIPHPITISDLQRRVAARTIALAHGLRCKLGEADDRSMHWAANTVLQTHAETDPLAIEIKTMSRCCRELAAGHRIELLKAAAERLLRAVERAS